MGSTTWHYLSAEEVVKQLDVSNDGLTSTEAMIRLARYGRNEIARRKPVAPWRLLARQFANFFVIVLLFATALAYAISFLPNEKNRRLTALFILGIVALTVLLSFFEEYRSQKELEALDRLLVFQAVVKRDGTPKQINANKVVPGDVLVLTQGQKVPADARMLQANGLRADESALTGESVGVDKAPEPVPSDAALAERYSMVFGSTYITQGSSLAVAVRTGMQTEVGQIAAAPQQMTVIVGSLAMVIAAVLLFLLHEPPIDVALNTLSLAIATIPESLPIVLTFALALGARQMAARRAVVRRLSVVESLGSVDTVCTDKTGTLTQNLMSVQRVLAGGQVIDLEHSTAGAGDPAEVLRAGVLCNAATIEDGAALKFIGDPVDTAMLRAAQAAGLDIEHERASYLKVGEIPFNSERKMMTTIHQADGQRMAYAKGAPGAVMAHCSSCWNGTQVVPFDDAQCAAVRQTIGQLQSQGMHVLALARKMLPASEAADDQAEEEMTLIGLQALIDPPRAEAARAIAQAQGAGIRVVMITGDNALTAQAIARQLGIGQRAVEASQLEDLAEDVLRRRMESIDIVARDAPD